LPVTTLCRFNAAWWTGGDMQSTDENAHKTLQDSMTLSAFAAEHRRLLHGAPSAGTRRRRQTLSIAGRSEANLPLSIDGTVRGRDGHPTVS